MIQLHMYTELLCYYSHVPFVLPPTTASGVAPRVVMLMRPCTGIYRSCMNKVLKMTCGYRLSQIFCLKENCVDMNNVYFYCICIFPPLHFTIVQNLSCQRTDVLSVTASRSAPQSHFIWIHRRIHITSVCWVSAEFHRVLKA